MLMNEVFGEENFVAQLIWKSRQHPDARATTGISTDHEYILVYSRSEEVRFRLEFCTSLETRWMRA